MRGLWPGSASRLTVEPKAGAMAMTLAVQRAFSIAEPCSGPSSELGIEQLQDVWVVLLAQAVAAWV